MKRFILSTVMALFMVSLMAQTGTSLSLSMLDAQRYALEHNRSLKNASLSVKQSEAQRWQTIATMLPQVSASFDYQDYCGYSMNLGGMSMAMNPSGAFTLTASMAVSGTQIVGTLLQNLALELQQVTDLFTEPDVSTNVYSVYIPILVMAQPEGLFNYHLKHLILL